MESTFHFGDEDYSNLTIECGEYAWVLNAEKVCTKSKFFKQEWKRAAKHGDGRVISMSRGWHPPSIHRAIEFLHCSDYDDEADMSPAMEKLYNGSIVETEAAPLPSHTGTRSGLSTDEYGVQSTPVKPETDADRSPTLVDTTPGKDDDSGVSAVDLRFRNNVFVGIFAIELSIDPLLTKALEKLQKDAGAATKGDVFFALIDQQFRIMPPPVRKLITQTCTLHYDSLVADNRFGMVLQSTPGFTVEMMSALRESTSGTKIAELQAALEKLELKHAFSADQEEKKRASGDESKIVTALSENCTRLFGAGNDAQRGRATVSLAHLKQHSDAFLQAHGIRREPGDALAELAGKVMGITDLLLQALQSEAALMGIAARNGHFKAYEQVQRRNAGLAAEMQMVREQMAATLKVKNAMEDELKDLKVQLGKMRLDKGGQAASGAE